MARLCAMRPEIGARRASFWFLDAFRPRSYRKVLCCDGDLLFRASVEALFDSPEALLCCRDQFSLRGRPRDRRARLRQAGPLSVASPSTGSCQSRKCNAFGIPDRMVCSPSAVGASHSSRRGRST